MADIVSQLVLKRTTLIELPLNGTIAPGSIFKFNSSEISKVSGKLVYGIDLVVDDFLAVMPSGRPTIFAADIVNLMLTLVEQKTNKRFINQSPSARFIPFFFSGGTQFIKPRYIDFVQSQFTVVAVGTLSNTQSIGLNVFWKEPEDDMPDNV